MKHLLPFLFFLLSLHTYGQACRAPSSLADIKPERCGIRHVTTEGDNVKVILEFEKRARILSPENPGDVRGKAVNLVGLYYMTYTADGEILSEERVFVQTEDIPDKGLIFGLNGQRGDLLEKDLKLISPAEYAALPSARVSKRDLAAAESREGLVSHFETDLVVDKSFKLQALEVIRWEKGVMPKDTLEPIASSKSLELFDSCTKKQYWTNLYLPTTDPAEGYTVALLNRFDRAVEKDISEKRFRLVSLDTAAEVAGQHDFEFPSPMDIEYREEIFGKNEDGVRELKNQVLVLKSKTAEEDNKIGQYYYYSFDKLAQLQTSALILSKYPVFNPINILREDKGDIYLNNVGHEIVSTFVGHDGQYNVRSTGDKLIEFKKLLENRAKNGFSRVSLMLEEDPIEFKDGTKLVIYQVVENVGVQEVVSSSTSIYHGFIVAQLNKKGIIRSVGFYQRPPNADPRINLSIGPVVQNDAGRISFYATERSSEGAYPIFCDINMGEVHIVKNEKGTAPASRQIYFDSDNAIAGYLGIEKDPNDSRQSKLTIEILKAF